VRQSRHPATSARRQGEARSTAVCTGSPIAHSKLFAHNAGQSALERGLYRGLRVSSARQGAKPRRAARAGGAARILRSRMARRACGRLKGSAAIGARRGRCAQRGGARGAAGFQGAQPLPRGAASGIALPAVRL